MQTKVRGLLTEEESGEEDSGAEAGELAKHPASSYPVLSIQQTAGPTPSWRG